jgi:hypothetical protein
MIALIGLAQSVGLAQTQARMNNQQMRALLTRLVQRTSTFTTNLDAALNRTATPAADNTERVRDEASNFSASVTTFRDKWETGGATASDARALLDQAGRLDRLVRRERLSTQTENSWMDLRFELDQLSAAYGLNTGWNDGTGPGGSTGPVVSSTGAYGNGPGYPRDALTGTYALNVSRSDDPRAAAEQAVGNRAGRNRQRALDELTAKLEAADRLAIDRQGQSVTIESSRAPQVTVVADGSVRTEQDQNGDQVQVRSSLAGDQLIITSTTSAGRTGASDYEVTFEPVNGGRSLRVTRKISSGYAYRQVIVRSVYDRTSDIAQLDPNSPGSSSSSGSSSSDPVDFIIPDGMVLMGVLNTSLSTETAHDNDRFTMTVRTPQEYNGAVVEGYISGVQRSGRVTGRSTMNLNFDTIRMPDGTTYRFAGLVESVRTQGGDEVKVTNEGGVQSNDSRGQTTAKRAGIGTAVGAVIGAIAGGGKGAAIGAAVGAGAGAGSVYAQGKDDLEMPNGTEIRVRASTPRSYSDTQ